MSSSYPSTVSLKVQQVPNAWISLKFKIRQCHVSCLPRRLYFGIPRCSRHCSLPCPSLRGWNFMRIGVRKPGHGSLAANMIVPEPSPTATFQSWYCNHNSYAKHWILSREAKAEDILCHVSQANLGPHHTSSTKSRTATKKVRTGLLNKTDIWTFQWQWGTLTRLVFQGTDPNKYSSSSAATKKIVVSPVAW